MPWDIQTKETCIDDNQLKATISLTMIHHLQEITGPDALMKLEKHSILRAKLSSQWSIAVITYKLGQLKYSGKSIPLSGNWLSCKDNISALHLFLESLMRGEPHDAKWNLHYACFAVKYEHTKKLHTKWISWAYT